MTENFTIFNGLCPVWTQDDFNAFPPQTIVSINQEKQKIDFHQKT
jgi:hypothetical protein